MTRIIAGAARGRRLETVPGTHTRPTSDRVREALFSALESDLGTLHGRAFLDLYAGSGGVGLEAWSRGAERVLLVEQSAPAVAVIRRNIATLTAVGADVAPRPTERLSRRPPSLAFDVVYVDPPYDLAANALGHVLVDLAESGWFTDGARVVVERDRRSEWTWPGGFEPMRDRTYGETMLWYGSVALRSDRVEDSTEED